MSENVDAARLDDAALNLAITDCAREEARTAGRRLAHVADLATRRLGSKLARQRERSAFDGWDSCAAEIACDLVITHRKASGMMYQALDLRDRIRMVGDLLRNGDISEKVATTASWRTSLIEDPAVLAKVDAELAEAATRWSSYSDEKLSDAIDAKIEKHDPDAVRRFHTAQKKLDMRFGKRDDATGTRSVFGLMDAANAEIGERRTNTLAKSVCPDDPRTLGERRIAAYGVIMAGGEVLPCLCGKPDCPAPTGDDARGKLFDILVLTDDPDAGTGSDENDAPTPDPNTGPDDSGPRYDPDYDWEQHWYDDPPPDEDDAPPPPEDDPEPGPAEPNDESVGPATTPAPCSYTSIFVGGTVIPAALLADIRRMGASVRAITRPEDLTTETGYRPSTALQRFVRARDMTCCFTGCNRPAEYCDVDHTTPHGPGGPTHPGNLKTLCRKHHLLKTFWVGEGGWSDEQLADGTIVWTSPSGLKHRAPPGSRIYFPTWDTTTPLPDTPPAAAEAPVPGRELRMPKRRRTRAQQRAADIKAERQRNHDDAEQNSAPF